MPRRMLAPCSSPGCPNLTRTRLCASCARESDLQRGSPTQRGYDNRWRRRAKSFLRRNPKCARCDEPATDVHHTTPRRELVAAGVPDPDADRWLESLCHAHHSAETVRESGFGRGP